MRTEHVWNPMHLTAIAFCSGSDCERSSYSCRASIHPNSKWIERNNIEVNRLTKRNYFSWIILYLILWMHSEGTHNAFIHINIQILIQKPELHIFLWHVRIAIGFYDASELKELCLEFRFRMRGNETIDFEFRIQ